MDRQLSEISPSDFEDASKKESITELIVGAIEEGIDLKLDRVDILAIKDSDMVLESSRENWKGGLERALEFYIEVENYQQCSRVRDLLKQL